MAADIAVYPDSPLPFEPWWPNDKASTGTSGTSPGASCLSSTSPTHSLNIALESSMKIWQPAGERVMGDLMSPGPLETTARHLNAALDFCWMDYPNKPHCKNFAREYVPPYVQGLDETSLSSGTRSTSHSPSPTPSTSTACFGGSNSTNPFAQSSASLSISGSVPAVETYSRKVFVGGLPPDIDQDEIKEQFVRHGPLTVDWPHKAQSKAYFPPKGYAFLLFRDEMSVHKLVDHCIYEEGKLFTFVSSVTQTNKKVQIRPWKLSDSDYIMDHTQPIDPRKTIFIGGVPRPLKAFELADIFNSRYGNVCYGGIDCDPELKYPKGAGRVTFSSRVSFMSAVSCRFLQITYGDIDKKVEVKPYVLDDQMCDECHGVHCGGRYAPYFCGNIHCLRYYCEHCWAAVHSAPGTQNHRCFIKENGDRPRAINFFPTQRPNLALP